MLLAQIEYIFVVDHASYKIVMLGCHGDFDTLRNLGNQANWCLLSISSILNACVDQCLVNLNVVEGTS